jgi:CHAD domain-containing protein
MNRPKSSVTTVLLARRTRALKRHLREAVQGDGHGVHQARVASRRLREAVPVLAAGLKKTRAGKARNKIRRITRALGAIRELDVTIGLLDELARRNTLPRLALEQVRAQVLQEQQRRRETMLERMERVDVTKLERRLRSLGEALAAAEAEPWRERLGARLLKRSKLLGAAVDEAGHMYDADRLHKVRIAAKKLRYSLEIAGETGIAAARQPVRTIKRAQDTLGRLHDLQVLQTHVAAVQAGPDAARVEAGLATIAQYLEQECRLLHARYVATVPALHSVVETTRTSIVPQLARPGRGQARRLKMDLQGRSRRAARMSIAAGQGN